METSPDGRLRMSEVQNIELIAQWDAKGRRFIMSARLVAKLPVPIKHERKRWSMARGKTVIHLVPVGKCIRKERASAMLHSFVYDPLLMVTAEKLPLFEFQGVRT